MRSLAVLPAAVLLCGCLGTDRVLEADLMAARRETGEARLRDSWTATADKRDPHARLAKENVYPVITPVWAGRQRLELGPVSAVLDDSNLNSSFLVSGRRCYEIGTLRGAFLARGIVFGDEAGVWSQPYKMLDGILVEVRVGGGAFVPVNGARETVNRMYCIEMVQSVEGLEVMRRDFAPQDEWAFFHQLELSNPGSKALHAQVRLTFQSNIRPIWHHPWFVEYGEDEVAASGDGRFVARDRYIKDLETAFGVHAPGLRLASSVDAADPFRPRGVVTFDLPLAGGETRRADLCAVQWDRRKVEAAESLARIPGAEAYLGQLISRADEFLEQCRQGMERSVIGGVRFACPDKLLQDAWHCALYNIDSLATDMRPYLAFPHLMACPERGYQMLFGIDTLYASPGATAAGLDDIVRATLDNHFFYAAQTGNRSIHYYVDHFGRHQDRGARAQETGHFIGTVWEYLKVTGDRAYAARIYPALREMLRGVESLDENGDSWPEGMTFPSLTRKAGINTELSAAVRLCWATRAMAELAEALDDPQAARRYRVRYEKLLARFKADWWVESEGCWAVGIRHGPDGRLSQIGFGHQNVRSLNYPQVYGLADPDLGRRALARVEAGAVDADGGLHAPAVTVWQNSLMAVAAYRYGRADLGLRLLARAARNPMLVDKMLGGFSTMNPAPGQPSANDNKIMYSWSCGPFAEAVLYGLMGIRPDAFTDTVRFNPQPPSEWETASVGNYRMGPHVVDFLLKDGRWTVAHREGDRPLRVLCGPAGEAFMLAKGESVSFPAAAPPAHGQQ